jgi:DNA polymerase-3 subunit gamma/tau
MSTTQQAPAQPSAQAQPRRWRDLYQKYRPFQLRAIVGQPNVVTSLTNAAKRDSFNHAYLLAGAYGSGKTSVARILASLMVCPDRKPGSDLVCGKCRYCESIHAGHCVDVVEIDGGEQTGVDDARDLKKSTAYTPLELKRKVYIIDECHKLSPAANSALLKVLEEPPPYVHFIFCTTEADKVLRTIVSRCQRYRLTKIPSELMAARLELVASKEGVKVEPGVARHIARLSDGSLRDAIGNLEQVAVFTDGNVTMQSTTSFFGMPEKRATYELVRLIAQGNASGLLLKANDLIMSCVDPKEILLDVSNVLRNVFIARSFAKDGREPDLSMLDVNDDEAEIVKGLAKDMPLEALRKMADSLGTVERRVAVHINERWIVEAALVGCVLILNNEAQKTIKAG